MSWPLASFLLLGAALAAGFAWYERARPTARMLALVATLAALAALGRIAFAPIPNVKPTTDIVLLAGYVLGAAPGFAVGARRPRSRRTSSSARGRGRRGRWLAWGGVGLAGAVLARRDRPRGSGRVAAAARLRRSPGSLFGAVMNLSPW